MAGVLVVSPRPVCGNNFFVPPEIERLYREHRAGLVRLVERELHDHHDAEDVVQTAFLDAQRALERGTIPRNPRAWLAAIALNTGRRLRRRRLNAAPLEEYAAQEASETPEIRAALARLPREQRTAVVYRDVLGLSYGETAKEMGTSVNAVTMLLHRGRRRLRQTLGVTTVGLGLWRWAKRAGTPQVAVVKGAAAVVVAGGLATTGVVAAKAIAPIGTTVVAAGPTEEAAVAPGGVLALDSVFRHFKAAGDSTVSDAAPSTHAAREDAAPASIRPSAAKPATSHLPSTLALPGVSVPTAPIPTSVAATVTVSTPVTALTVTAATATTVTVTTPITTVTAPIP